jgi:glycosyltransferase involved in cell wall biosynthesis
MLVYNADSLLYYALAPILPLVDEVIIVNSSPEGPSTDLSKDIIQHFNSDKIKYFEGSFGKHDARYNWDIVQHNFAFQQCTCEWIWKIDADEIYDELAARTVVNACKQKGEYDYLQWGTLYFVRDTQHIRVVPPPIRCWRNLPGLEFRDLSVTPVIDNFHIQVVRKGRWLPSITMYHYGFILPYRRQFQRIYKFILRENDDPDKKIRPRVHIESHLRDAWQLHRNQILEFSGFQPNEIRKSLFYKRGESLSKLSVGIQTEGKYNQRDGVGGSELSLALCIEAMKRRGIKVIAGADIKGSFDVFINFRSIFDASRIDAKVKIWWMCDQYIDLEAQQHVNELHESYDLIFAISNYQRNYLCSTTRVPINKVKVINLGIDRLEYEDEEPKKRNSLIYCSQPDRGLEYLAPMFKRIVEAVPDATLTITSDKTLWGLPPSNEKERGLFADIPNVEFLGAVSRERLLNLQKRSEIMAYPCSYEELFCISAIECQAAGCCIVTTNIGALSETVADSYSGFLIPGHPSEETYQASFTDHIIQLLTTERDTLKLMQKQGRQRAMQFYTWDDLLYEWSFYIDTVFKLKGLTI